MDTIGSTPIFTPKTLMGEESLAKAFVPELMSKKTLAAPCHQNFRNVAKLVKHTTDNRGSESSTLSVATFHLSLNIYHLP